MTRHLYLASCLALIALTCGGPRDLSREARVAEVIAALESVDHVLDEDQAASGWIRSGLEPLRHLRTAVREGDPGVRAIAAEAARRRLSRADVIVVADLHHFDLVRTSLGRLIEAVADPEALAAGRVALALEAVPQGMGKNVEDLVRRRDRAALLALLRAYWPWPVEAYVDLLLHPRLRHVHILGARVSRTCPVPGPDTPDGERTPVPTLDLGFGNGMDFADWKYGTTFSTNNAIAAYVAKRWIEEGEGDRQVFLLYGAAHLFDEGEWSPPDAIVPQLGAAGIRTMVVVPFLPSWELELRRRFGPAAEHSWYEVLDGVLRPPYATADAILDLAKE